MRRRRKTENGATVWYNYDAAGNVINVEDGTGPEPGASGSPTDLYVRGPVPGGILARRFESSGTWVYFHQDHLGSTRLLTDDSRAVIGTFEFDPYGNTLSATGWAPGFRFRYTGKEWDAASGFYHFPAREYVPGVQRWTTLDPAYYIDGVNLYQYAKSSPINFADPTGLSVALTTVLIYLAIGAAIAGLTFLADTYWGGAASDFFFTTLYGFGLGIALVPFIGPLGLAAVVAVAGLLGLFRMLETWSGAQEMFYRMPLNTLGSLDPGQLFALCDVFCSTAEACDEGMPEQPIPIDLGPSCVTDCIQAMRGVGGALGATNLAGFWYVYTDPDLGGIIFDVLY